MRFVYKSHACQLYGFAWGVASDPESRPMWGHTWLSLFIGYVQLICFLTFFHLSPAYLLPWINVLDFGWLEFMKWLWHRIITKQSFLSYEMIFRNLPVYTNCVLVELLEWKRQFMQCDPPSLQDNTEGILLVDATNVFNSLNCNMVHHNLSDLSFLCSYFDKTYRSAALYIAGDMLLSEEGTTQGTSLPCRCMQLIQYLWLNACILMSLT